MATTQDSQDDLERFNADVAEFCLQPGQQRQASSKFKHWVLIGSLALFVAVYAIPGISKPSSGLVGIVILVGVLFLHELGHFFAMKRFGYQNTSMFFLPFLGAAVTGNKHDATLAQKVLMLLAGPLPGIVLGIGITMAMSTNPYNTPGWLSETSLMLIVVNFLNLLPIYPLDGGKIANLLLCRYPYAEVWFKIVSVLALVGFGLRNFPANLPLLLIAIVIGITIPNSFCIAQMYRRLQACVKQFSISDNRIIHVSFKVVDEYGGVLSNTQRYNWVRDLVQRYQDASRRTTRIFLSIAYLASLIGSIGGTYLAYELPGWKQVRESAQFSRDLLQETRANTQKEIEAANQALRSNANDLEALHQRAAYRVKLYIPEETQAAIRDYDQILQIQPNHQLAYLGRGNARVQLKDYHGAIADFEQVIRLYPDDGLASQYQGNARSAVGDFKGAIADYEQATRLQSNLTPAWDLYDRLNRSGKPLNDTLQEHDQALGTNPQNVDLYWQRGEIRYVSGNIQGALQDYDQALRLNPQNAKGYLKRATIRVMLRDFKGAIADYDQTIRLDPQIAEAYLSRIAARALLPNSYDYRKKNFEDAEKVLSLKPEAVGMYFKLAQLRDYDDYTRRIQKLN